ncbi:DNA glycosylase [Ruegeria sp. ANG-S4]|uniref:very short patch repair endonuclease n=1 Tax=Ruegeria sp. ANG-S4 TaxID=1577904 RepID=UPI00057F44F8|nr:very short patch repair endonuclease [Ruegeria sp. ANG-S4]KIC45348.1 DNA glycosylase [Ruegeria sp. ANG-S4]
MTDVHDRETRSRNMAAIRGRDTKPEKLLRSALHRAGFRFRLSSSLPGKPDLAMKKYRAALFVHGCFWHMHDCPRFKQPGGENSEFWRRKLRRNAERDIEVTSALLASGWRQFVVWECALMGRGRLEPPEVVGSIGEWLISDAATGEISGKFD